MKPKHKRMAMIGGALGVLAIAAVLVLSALEQNIVFFHSPSDVAARKVPPGKHFRIGGLVVKGSVRRSGKTVAFRVTDGSNAVRVAYIGILPDLFREGWGRSLLPPEALAAVRYAYHRYGVLGIFLTRFPPGVRAAVMPFAGVVALPPERALIPAFLASALWYAGLIVVGSALGLQWEAIRALVIGANRALSVVALIAAALFALWMARWMRRADR